MDVGDLWGVWFPTYNDEALIQNHYYKRVVANPLGVAIGTKKLQILLQEQKNAAW